MSALRARIKQSEPLKLRLSVSHGYTKMRLDDNSLGDLSNRMPIMIGTGSEGFSNANKVSVWGSERERHKIADNEKFNKFFFCAAFLL